jgi:hypothetical protein
VRVAVEVGVEEHSFFGDFAQRVEREDLEASGIREDRTGPRHEFVETSKAAYGFMSGAEEEMIGVRKDDLGVECIGKIAWHHALHRGLCSDGHKYRSFDCSVRGMEQTGSGSGDWALCFELEKHEKIRGEDTYIMGHSWR